MKRIHSVEAAAKNMTLGELRTFIHDLDAASVDDAAEVKVRVNFGGGLKSITITEEAEPSGPPRVMPGPWNN